MLHSIRAKIKIKKSFCHYLNRHFDILFVSICGITSEVLRQWVCFAFTSISHKMIYAPTYTKCLALFGRIYVCIYMCRTILFIECGRSDHAEKRTTSKIVVRSITFINYARAIQLVISVKLLFSTFLEKLWHLCFDNASKCRWAGILRSLKLDSKKFNRKLFNVQNIV